MSTIKRNRTLMIDNQASDLINENKLNNVLEEQIEDDEDDEDVSTIENLRNGFNMNRIDKSQRQHIVELKDDEEEEENKSFKRKLSNNNIDYINDTEIETINTSKNVNMLNDNISTSVVRPPVKKLKGNSNEITTINLYQPNSNFFDLKSLDTSKKNSNQQFLDSNMFLNTNDSSLESVPSLTSPNSPQVQTLDSQK